MLFCDCKQHQNCTAVAHHARCKRTGVQEDQDNPWSYESPQRRSPASAPQHNLFDSLGNVPRRSRSPRGSTPASSKGWSSSESARFEALVFAAAQQIKSTTSEPTDPVMPYTAKCTVPLFSTKPLTSLVPYALFPLARCPSLHVSPLDLSCSNSDRSDNAAFNSNGLHSDHSSA